MQLLALTWRTWWLRQGRELSRCQPSMSHVGYRDRTCLTDEAGEAHLSAKNGMFSAYHWCRVGVLSRCARRSGVAFVRRRGEAHAQEARALMKETGRWMSK